MVPLDQRPIMEFVVAALRTSGVSRLLVILQNHPAPIVEHFGSGLRFGVAIDYAIQEGELGTAGSVRQALELIGDDEFLVVASDILFHDDLSAGEGFHHDRRSIATIALTEVEDPSQFGAVETDREGRVLRFVEKPASSSGPQLVNAGIYFLDRKVLQKLPAGMPADFGRDVFPALVRDHAPVFGFRLPGYWRDIGTFQGLQAARRDVRELPVFKDMTTLWPASRSGDGGRIWIRQHGPSWEWLEMDSTSIGRAAGLVWKHLVERRGRPATLSEIQKLKGVASSEALAAVGWLAREGKLLFKQEGRTTKVALTAEELHSLTR
jgi:dTDP-glucose pyrophosphorylase